MSTQPANQPTIDVARLIKRFGGRTKLRASLSTKGINLSIQAFDKWRERQSIPIARLLQLGQLAESEGNPFRLNDFIINPPATEEKPE